MVLDADRGLLLDAMTPARSDARIQILATGLGRVQPEWPTWLAAPLESPPRVVAPVKVYLDRMEAGGQPSNPVGQALWPAVTAARAKPRAPRPAKCYLISLLCTLAGSCPQFSRITRVWSEKNVRRPVALKTCGLTLMV